MAITYPRPMPSTGVGGQVFEIQRSAYLAPERRGRIGAMAAGFPLWSAQWTLGKGIGPSTSDDWRAFMDSLHGPSRLFLGREFGRAYPRAHPAGFGGMLRHSGGGFDGSASSWSLAITADSQPRVTLTGLPDDLVLSPGDYVDFRWTTGGEDRRSLVRSLEAATVSGGALVFTSNIPVPAITPATAVAHLDNPCCLMRMDTSSQVQPMDRRRVSGATINAIQDLLP